MYNYVMRARGKFIHDKRKDSNIIKNIEKGICSCIILIIIKNKLLLIFV